MALVHRRTVPNPGVNQAIRTSSITQISYCKEFISSIALHIFMKIHKTSTVQNVF